MEYNDIQYSKEAGVATITLNRPQKMNSYTQQTIGELLAAIDDADRDDQVRVLVLTGSGPNFCCGSDISPGGFTPLSERKHPLDSAIELRHGFHRVIHALTELDKPTIASIDGYAISGGLVLALLCDIRIASERARLGDSSLRFGLIPDEGGTYFLSRVVGLAKSLELIILREIVDAAEARRIGLVSRVVPPDQLHKATQELATSIAQGPPIALRLTKRAIYRQRYMDLESSLEDVALAAQIVNKTEDAIEGQRAFWEKKQPVFKGR